MSRARSWPPEPQGQERCGHQAGEDQRGGPGPPRSAHRPAKLAHSAPPAPTSPNSPMVGVAVVVGRAGQQEGHGGPEHTEGGEAQRPEHGPAAQQRLGDEQARRRAEQGAVADARARALARQHRASTTARTAVVAAAIR